jgi:translation elongation factor EF-1beta
MGKKAIVTISLVPESENVSNKRIEREIRETLKCSWLAEIEKVEIEESENCVIKKLTKKGSTTV